MRQHEESVMKNKVRKVLRYCSLYGFSRTIIKVAGRTRNTKFNIFFPVKHIGGGITDISLIGCGQFGFSTISYFLYMKLGSRFLECYDIDSERSLSTARFWNYRFCKDYHTLVSNPKCKYVYIASDHFTHSKYAIEAIKAGKIVYCEKPISVTIEQLQELIKVVRQYHAEIYFGYNRPFSRAINDLLPYIRKSKAPISLSCFVSGHKLSPNHWYNDPKEGTRICGNLGHWIDLSIFLFEQRGIIPKTYDINITYAEKGNPDDNISVSYSTEYGDLVSLVLTSRTEPFEGINETINLQCSNVISKIDDFQKQTLWIGEKKYTFKYTPKDVGHSQSINQPFLNEKRDIETIFISTRLMLEIKDLVIERKERGRLSVTQTEMGRSYENSNVVF